MTKLFKPAALAAAAAASFLAGAVPAAAVPAFVRDRPVSAQDAADSWQHSRHDRGNRHGHYRGSRYYGEPVYRNTRVWRGNDGRYYCRRGNGTTGLIVGGALGALLGREIDGGYHRSTGTILGAAGGALLGRSIDRNNARCR